MNPNTKKRFIKSMEVPSYSKGMIDFTRATELTPEVEAAIDEAFEYSVLDRRNDGPRGPRSAVAGGSRQDNRRQRSALPGPFSSYPQDPGVKDGCQLGDHAQGKILATEAADRQRTIRVPGIVSAVCRRAGVPDAITPRRVFRGRRYSTSALRTHTALLHTALLR